MHCVKFWFKVLTSEMYEGRLLRKIDRLWNVVRGSG